MSLEAINRLVKLVARAFYDDITTKGGKNDNKGIAVVVLDALTRRQWVREEDLPKDLKLPPKHLRRILHFFEEEKFVTREHRRETVKPAVAATKNGQQSRKEEEEKIKMHTHSYSYCCLDYAQIYDVLRYRLHRMKKKLKDELEDQNNIQKYICGKCGKRYNALDAISLVSAEDEFFHGEFCNGKLVVESDTLPNQGGGDGDDNGSRQRREMLKIMLQKMEVQLKPLVQQLARVKDLVVPEFGSLQAWEAKASAATLASNGEFGDTKVEVAFSGVEGKVEDNKSEADATSPKVLPPWMIKQGVNLIEEQCGISDDKKPMSTEIDNKTSSQDDYIIKAYYAAILKKQQECLEEAARKPLSSGRRVGIKSKRDEDGDNEDDIDWEES